MTAHTTAPTLVVKSHVVRKVVFVSSFRGLGSITTVVGLLDSEHTGDCSQIGGPFYCANSADCCCCCCSSKNCVRRGRLLRVLSVKVVAVFAARVGSVPFRTIVLVVPHGWRSLPSVRGGTPRTLTCVLDCQLQTGLCYGGKNCDKWTGLCSPR